MTFLIIINFNFKFEAMMNRQEKGKKKSKVVDDFKKFFTEYSTLVK